MAVIRRKHAVFRLILVEMRTIKAIGRPERHVKKSAI